MIISWESKDSSGRSAGATPAGMPVLWNGIDPMLIEDLNPGDKFTWTTDDKNFKTVVKSTTRVRISLEIDTTQTPAEVEKEILNALPGAKATVKEVKKGKVK